MVHDLQRDITLDDILYLCCYDYEEPTHVQITRIGYNGDDYMVDEVCPDLVKKLESEILERHQEHDSYVSEIAGKMYRGRI